MLVMVVQVETHLACKGKCRKVCAFIVYSCNDILHSVQLTKQNVNASKFTLKPLKQNLFLSNTFKAMVSGGSLLLIGHLGKNFYFEQKK